MTRMAEGILGAVLAGGESRRFGASKTLSEVGGLPMASWAIKALKDAGLFVGVISSEDDLEGVLGVPVRPDLEPGKGPVGGLLTALAWAKERKHTGVFLLGCDMPLVSVGVVSELLSKMDASAAIIPIGLHGAEPLCGFYSLSCFQAVRRVLDSRDNSMHRLLELIQVKEVQLVDTDGVMGPGEAFFNVNTREEALEVDAILTDQRSKKIEG